MAERTKTNPTGAPLTPPPITARRLWGRVLVGAPVPIPASDVCVIYDLDRTMGLSQHLPDILAPVEREEKALLAAYQARKTAFAEQWAGLVARKLGTTQSVVAQLEQVAAILNSAASGAAKLTDLRRYLGTVDLDPPTVTEWAAYEAAQADQEAANAADDATLAALERRRWLAIIADVVVQVGVAAGPDPGAGLTWDRADGPYPDPHDPASWAAVPDLILSWICNAGVTQATLQVDSFRYGRPSAATSRA